MTESFAEKHPYLTLLFILGLVWLESQLTF